MRASKRFLPILLLLTVATSAIGQSSFPGHITLPKGYVMKKPFCFDTYCGSFVREGSPTIHFDIGEMAGVSANEPVDPSAVISKRVVTLPSQTAIVLVRRIQRREQREMNGRKALYDRELKLIVVSFPDSRANFYSFLHTKQEIDFVETAALTFIPDTSLKRPENPFEFPSKPASK